MDENEVIESVARYDAVALETKFDSTPEGFLTGTAVVTRVGVFPYMAKDGSGTIQYELRHPDDVFHADSLATLLMKPVTNDHPKVGLVNSSTAKDYIVGAVGNTPIHNDSFLSIPLVVHDAKAVKDVKNGKRQLSCGYKCDLVKEEGTWNGIKYNLRQTNIRYNHVAIVKQGRAGEVARIRLDGAEAPIDIENTKEISMDDLKTINLDSVDYQADSKVIEALQAHKAKAEETQVKLDEAQVKLDTILAEKTKIEAERDATKERLDAMEKELTALKANHVDADKVGQLVKERVALEAFAQKAEVEVKTDMDDVTIKKAVVQKLFPTVVVEKLDNLDYLNARYDTALEEFDNIQKKNDSASVRSINANKTDEADKPAKKSYEEVRKAYRHRLQTAHKGKGE